MSGFAYQKLNGEGTTAKKQLDELLNIKKGIADLNEDLNEVGETLDTSIKKLNVDTIQIGETLDTSIKKLNSDTNEIGNKLDVKLGVLDASIKKLGTDIQTSFGVIKKSIEYPELKKLAQEFAPNLSLEIVSFSRKLKGGNTHIISLDGLYFGKWDLSLTSIQKGSGHQSRNVINLSVYEGANPVYTITSGRVGKSDTTMQGANGEFVGFGSSLMLNSKVGTMDADGVITFIGYRLGEPLPEPEIPEGLPEEEDFIIPDTIINIKSLTVGNTSMCVPMFYDGTELKEDTVLENIQYLDFEKFSAEVRLINLTLKTETDEIKVLIEGNKYTFTNTQQVFEASTLAIAYLNTLLIDKSNITIEVDYKGYQITGRGNIHSDGFISGHEVFFYGEKLYNNWSSNAPLDLTGWETNARLSFLMMNYSTYENFTITLNPNGEIKMDGKTFTDSNVAQCYLENNLVKNTEFDFMGASEHFDVNVRLTSKNSGYGVLLQYDDVDLKDSIEKQISDFEFRKIKQKTGGNFSVFVHGHDLDITYNGQYKLNGEDISASKLDQWIRLKGEKDIVIDFNYIA